MEKNSWNWQLAESVKLSWMLPELFLITGKAVEVLASEIGESDPLNMRAFMYVR